MFNDDGDDRKTWAELNREVYALNEKYVQKRPIPEETKKPQKKLGFVEPLPKPQKEPAFVEPLPKPEPERIQATDKSGKFGGLVGGGRRPATEWTLLNDVLRNQGGDHYDPLDMASLVVLKGQLSALGMVCCDACDGYGHHKGICPTASRMAEMVKGNPSMSRLLSGAYFNIKSHLPGYKSVLGKRLKLHDYKRLKRLVGYNPREFEEDEVEEETHASADEDHAMAQHVQEQNPGGGNG